MTGAGSGGRRIGRFEIEEELGRGTMGVVYRATDPALGRTVALKVTHIAFSIPEKDRQGFEERFQAEARAAAAVADPGVVVVHDVGRDPETGDLFIAFEHLSGRTLAEMARETPLEWREALRITARVAQTLQSAHASGIVHCDIKPANIMLLPSGQPKILDFGVARLRSASPSSNGDILGTPLYMSPEQLKAGEVDGRSDLFSLGAVLYWLLTGKEAFAGGGNLQAIAGRVLLAHPPPPSLLVAGLPAEVDRVVARALAKPPADRYPDGASLAAALECILAEDENRWASLATVIETPPGGDAATAATPVQEPAPAAPTDRPPAKRRRTAVWAGVSTAVLTLVAIVGGGLGLFLRGAAPGRANPAPPVHAATPAPRPPTSVTTPVSLPPPDTATPSGQLVIGFDHPFEYCVLRVFVAETLVLQERVRTPRKDFWTPAALGTQDVRVEVQWTGGERAKSVAGTFSENGPQRLEVRVDREASDLSLEWR